VATSHGRAIFEAAWVRSICATLGEIVEVLADGGLRGRRLPGGGNAGLVAEGAACLDELLGRTVQLRFGLGVGRRRDQGEGPGALERSVHQVLGSDEFVDQPAGVRRGRFDPFRGEEEAVGGRAERVPHDLQSGEREGEADQHFGHPDGARGHQAQIARGGQHASAREGVAVDRGHDRSRGVEQGQERLVEHRQEFRDVRRATVADAAQIDAGGEDRAGAGEHDRPGVGVPAHGRGDRVAKLDVQGADLAVREPAGGASTGLASDRDPQGMDWPGDATQTSEGGDHPDALAGYDAETRPGNVYAHYFIKFRHVEAADPDPHAIPVGMVLLFAGDAADPAVAGQLRLEGWLPCFGQVLKPAEYQGLFDVVRYKFGGTGDGFSLPDLRGQFVRGARAAARSGPGETIGASQGYATMAPRRGTASPLEATSDGAHRHKLAASDGGYCLSSFSGSGETMTASMSTTSSSSPSPPRSESRTRGVKPKLVR
jgi:microcystin-dependent protein